MTIASEIDLSRFELAVRKFLTFERACGRAQHLSRYCELLRKAFEGGRVEIQIPADAALLERLVQVGLLQQIRQIDVRGPSMRWLRTDFRPLCIPESSPDSPDWLSGALGSHDILRFYAMRSAGIGWIMRDLEAQVSGIRTSQGRDRQNRIARNTALLGQIWRICLHYELTEADWAGGDAPDLEFDPEPPFENAPQTAVMKEKLGLARLPNVFQLRHIKATCHYHRKSANW